MESRVKWFSKIMDLKENPGLIYIIRGPRQVGKSTHALLKIRELLKKVEPFNILYVHCEAFSRRKELDQAIREYLRSTRGVVWIFIDEATHIKDWYVSIKYFKDIGLLDNAIVVITGSSSLDLARASNYLSGRRGENIEQNLDRVLLPMSFREALLTAFGSQQLKRFIRRSITQKTLLEVISGRIPLELRKILAFWDEISDAFEKYLITGGYPLTIDEYLKKRRISTSIYNLFITLVRRDLEKYGYDPLKVDQVMRRLIETLTEPVDYETLKSGTDIRSSTRLSDYLTALQNSYIVTPIPYINPSEKRVIMRKRRKYYFRDPFIYHAFRAWTLGLEPFEASKHAAKDPTIKGIIIENIICEYLVRYVTAYNNRPLIDPQSHMQYIGYWKTKKGEVDFIVRLKNKYIPVEVKFREKIQRSSLRALIKTTQTLRNRGIVISKKPEDLIEEQHYIAIPAQIFAIIFPSPSR